MAEEKFLSAQKILVFAAGLVLGLVVGFLLTNQLNRRELEEARAAAAARPAPTPSAPSGSPDLDELPNLTDEQLREAAARADAAPSDAGLQRVAGQALYYYAMSRGKTSVLPDAARILRRAHEADPKDYNTALLAGNANLFLARSQSDAARLAEARRFYEGALAAKPDDVNARTSLGLTFYFATPSDPRRAIREYRRALEADPQSEFTLQSLVAALTEAGELDEAERRLTELEGAGGANPEVANLRAQLEQKRNAARDAR